MNLPRPSLTLALLCAGLAAPGCSRPDPAPLQVPTHTAQGEAERVDRLQFLSGASSAVVRAEDLYRRDQPSDDEWKRALRLIELSRDSATKAGEGVEANWERKAAAALSLILAGVAVKDPARVEQGLEQVKLYVDQAQQAASIEF
ncbi:MAG: hypothetical protein ACHQCF_08700 [Solirubrobacterales bacterium]